MLTSLFSTLRFKSLRGEGRRADVAEQCENSDFDGISNGPFGGRDLVFAALKLAQEKRQCANSRSVNHSLKFEERRLLYLLGLTKGLGIGSIRLGLGHGAVL